jgi:predicted ATPase
VNDTDSIIGPYRILEPLARGGMGVVYRAEHLVTGEPAALKTVRVPHERMLAGIRREILALARIRHPGIIRIVAEGLHEGLPWYAMELLEGRSLRKLAPNMSEEVPTLAVAPQPAARGKRHAREKARRGSSRRRPAAAGGRLAEVLSVVRRLCAPLAFLHGEGMVHRDLKPDNVLVRPDGRPVLVDFGLTLQFWGRTSREDLELMSGFAGTAAYMSPEQGRGELVDARADLYALGCILYELLTGRKPFLGESDEIVLSKHLEAAPIPVSELVDGVSPELDLLVLRLLAKDPPERPGHAGVVAQALGRLGADEAPDDAAPRPRAYLYRPGLAGRQDAMLEMDRHVERLCSGRGGIVLVAGESGVGKTRLTLEAARRGERRRLMVLTGGCVPPEAIESSHSAGAAGSLQALRRPLQALADYCREHGPEETQRLLGRHAPVLALYEPAFAALAGAGAERVPGGLPPDVARRRLFGILAETFTRLAARSPVLLVLDDLQWADDLTLGFLRHVLQTADFETLPLLGVGTCRTEDMSAELIELLGLPAVRRVDLGRLDERGVGAMVGDMLAITSPPPDFVRFLTRQSEGNPFFVAEYLRTAVTEGLLFRNAAGRWQVTDEVLSARESAYETLPLPVSIRELIRRRLDSLAPKGWHLIEVASVLGRDIDEELLAEIAGVDLAGTLEEQLGELVRRQLLEADSASGRLRFAHDRIRDVAYENIEPERRRELHRQAAEAMDARLDARLAEPLAALGLHWERAGRPERARVCYLAAARGAAARYALEEAERLYRAYLALAVPSAPESLAARNEMARDILALRGQYHEAELEHRRCLEEARALGNASAEGQSLQALAGICRNVGRLEEAISLCGQALEIFRRLGDRSGEALTLNDLGSVQWNLGHLEEANAMYLRALEIHRACGDRRLEGNLLTNLAGISMDRGSLDEARALYLRALQIHRQVGNRRIEGLTLGNLAVIEWSLGRLPEALELFQQALGIHREIGNRRSEAIALGNLAGLEERQGRHEEARRMYLQALGIHREIGNRLGEGGTLTNLGTLCCGQGRLRESRSFYEQALGIYRELRSPIDTADALLGMATLLRRSGGDLVEARRLAEEALDLYQGLETPLEKVPCLCELGTIELALGQPPHAYLRQAQELLAHLETPRDGGVGDEPARLERAIEAAERGEPMWRGEPLAELSDGLRQALGAAGLLAGAAPR